VNRLQARLDEEEFGLVETPKAATEETTESPVKQSTVVTEKTTPPVPPVAVSSASTAATDKPKSTTTPQKDVKPAAPKQDVVAGLSVAKGGDNGSASVPSKETTTTTPAVSVTDTKISGDLSFEEKKRRRAARFGIAVVEQKDTSKPNSKPNKRQKISPKEPSGQKNQAQKNKKDKTNNAGTSKPKKDEPKLLPKEEIEKRLKRAEKYGIQDNKQTEELKAMLRKYRFDGSAGAGVAGGS
jgi:SAP domain-containing ribonucleoprotein